MGLKQSGTLRLSLFFIIVVFEVASDSAKYCIEILVV